eukprot:CAMPEP_0170636170 /NCGR_PEP_ID=MMETSP0224-20130122/37639_1 /TAXON_ID=285029 /ORGANISM="Togula jolla, Strain CCCM 725" /LENGTH=223 /DNA_ID=CAMNT_0010965773 /DNA_START=70 /DNA_END=738 /DNA_ORIENTATION=+
MPPQDPTQQGPAEESIAAQASALQRAISALVGAGKERSSLAGPYEHQDGAFRSNSENLHAVIPSYINRAFPIDGDARWRAEMALARILGRAPQPLSVSGKDVDPVAPRVADIEAVELVAAHAHWPVDVVLVGAKVSAPVLWYKVTEFPLIIEDLHAAILLITHRYIAVAEGGQALRVMELARFRAIAAEGEAMIAAVSYDDPPLANSDAKRSIELLLTKDSCP